MTTAITLLNINIALGCVSLALDLAVLVYLLLATGRPKRRPRKGAHGK